MNKKAPIVLVIIIVLFISAALLAEEQPHKATSLHHFDLSCDTCHTPASSGSASRQGAANVGKVTGDINRLCTFSGCHNFDPLLSHPVSVTVKGVIPIDMPLDSFSRITCLTCHEQQKVSDGLNISNNVRDRSLYLPEGIQFCATCHVNMGGTTLEQSHWRFSTRAHLDSASEQSGQLSRYARFVGGIDVESRTCLSCHEDVTVTIPVPNETRQQKRIRWQRMSDHPIGMDYAHVAMRKAAEYQYPQMDNRRIRLFGGRVGCGSCHSLYAQTDNNLVVRYKGGFLCRQCHNK